MPSNTAISAGLDALLDMARVVRDEDDLRRVLSQLVALVAQLLEMRSVVLNLYRPEWGRRAGDAELRVLRDVARHAARAIEEAKANARARRHRRALESLLAVSSELGRRPDPAPALQGMCDAIRDAFGFRRVAVTVA